MATNVTVAVVGLGGLGLVAMKNLLEERFEVTGFDRNGYVGGLWKYTADDQTSVLQSTIANTSKLRSCFTDFPFAEDVPAYPTAAHMEQYLRDYADHFSLFPHIHLNTDVQHITFDQDREQWAIEILDRNTMYFDKVVLATGKNSIPYMPEIDGIDVFTGDYTHSSSFKRPSDLKDKRVMVVGFVNSAADTAIQLVGHASEVYLSHRRGNYIIPRIVNGRPFDHSHTHRITLLQEYMWRYFPSMAEIMSNNRIKKIQDECFSIRPEWCFAPAPTLKQSLIIVSDDLIPALSAGHVNCVSGIHRITGGKTVELQDGEHVEVDSIIFCTGYEQGFSILDPKYDPSVTSPNGKRQPHLFQNMLSLEKPESLAFVGYAFFPVPQFALGDLATMALAQIWKGNYKLPPQTEMEMAVDKHHAWIRELAKNGSVYSCIVKPGEWMRWAHEAAGTGVNENLGYGWKGWWYWLRNRKFCNLLMSGIYSPHIARLFDGRRKKWDGAREAVIEANERASERSLGQG